LRLIACLRSPAPAPRPIGHRTGQRPGRRVVGRLQLGHVPGRTTAYGQSTFLNNDFIPECVQRGWLPVYVDLWSDRDAAPAQLISGAIGTALARFEGALARTAKKAGIDKINLLRT
jgi:hypothetical protein